VNTEFFESIRKRIGQFQWLIEYHNIVSEYDEENNIGMISGKLIFKDSTILHFKEIYLDETRRYRYHYMDESSNLICRWDDAPHHSDLKTFPYHIHLADGIKESPPVFYLIFLIKL
jgi:hypothetical protein